MQTKIKSNLHVSWVHEKYSGQTNAIIPYPFYRHSKSVSANLVFDGLIWSEVDQLPTSSLIRFCVRLALLCFIWSSVQPYTTDVIRV